MVAIHPPTSARSVRHLAVTAACWVLGLASGCSAPPPPVEAPPPKVTVQRPVERQIVESQRFNGWMDAAQTVEIRSRVRGHITKIHFTDGQVVKADALLYELDPRPIQAEIDSAIGQQKVFKAEAEFAAAEEARQKQLFNKAVAAKSDYEKAVAYRKSMDAKVEAADQDVNRKKLDLDYAHITAPIGGKISRSLLDEGNLVNAGGTEPVLTTIVALEPIYIYFPVDERALLQYRNKNASKTQRSQTEPLKNAKIPFEFGTDVDRGYPHKGILDYSSNRIDAKSGTFEVRGEASNASGQFLPGSRVRVLVPVSEPYQAIIVPDTAILSDQDRRYVLVVNPEKTVIRRDVQLGRLQDDGMRVILPAADKKTSLTAADWIVVLGLQRARVNEPVEPVDANGEAVDVAAGKPAVASRKTGE